VRKFASGKLALKRQIAMHFSALHIVDFHQKSLKTRIACHKRKDFFPCSIVYISPSINALSLNFRRQISLASFFIVIKTVCAHDEKGLRS